MLTPTEIVTILENFIEQTHTNFAMRNLISNAVGNGLKAQSVEPKALQTHHYATVDCMSASLLVVKKSSPTLQGLNMSLGSYCYS